ncbi:efflux transporter outer membrane subunit [Catenovulum sp. 2E275]|uniref:efflux transporter outer membrane subunit n=1 Tax=Catenovulum sp. 2E275 TaxID=2980497 RepID=UPI0021D28901|nr:efflux transporter outer membrane subunit [Catenovulum sp. 2E275]MCU4675860.1 efflux transporter outer membrane subunit [Catenovulum sp. 2E275]
MKSVLATSLIIILSGCAYQPNEYDLTMAMPNSLTEQSQQTVVNIQQSVWWQQFGSAQLNHLMAQLANDNLNLQTAQLRLEKAHSALAQQEAENWFSINSSARQSYGYGFDNNSESNSNSLGFSAGYEVDLWGAREAANASAELNLVATQQQLESTLLQLQSQLASLYFNHISLQQRLNIGEQNLSASESLLTLIQTKFEAGSVSGIEVSQQKNSYLSAQSQLMKVKRDLQVSERALAALLGQSDMALALNNEDINALSIPAISAQQSAELLMRRPDIQIAQTQLKMQDASLYQTEQRKWPSLSISSGLSSSDLLNLGSGWAASLAAGLSMPIFNAGQIDAQIEAAKTDVDIAVVNYRETVVQAVKESLDTITDLEYQNTLFGIRAEELANNQQLYELAQIRFDSGDTDFINLLNAQRSWFSAKLTFATAKLDVLQANVDVFRALAGSPSLTAQ